MDALRLGILALFNAGGDFFNDIPNRLFFGDAEGANLAEGDYGIFFFVSDNPDDVFAKEGKEVYVQFSLFSGSSSPAAILAMAMHLEAMLKDKTFTVTGWTVRNTFLQQENGPINVPADTEAGTGRYWQTDIDYRIDLQKS
jgi:hypothetical protein